MISDEIVKKAEAARRSAHGLLETDDAIILNFVGEASQKRDLANYDEDINAMRAALSAVLPMIVEKCAEAAEGNALQWINGEATTSYGQAYQAGSRGAATAIRSLARP